MQLPNKRSLKFEGRCSIDGDVFNDCNDDMKLAYEGLGVSSLIHYSLVNASLAKHLLKLNSGYVLLIQK